MRALWAIYRASIAEAASAEDLLATANTREALRGAADPLARFAGMIPLEAPQAGVLWASGSRGRLEHSRREATA